MDSFEKSYGDHTPILARFIAVAANGRRDAVAAR